MEDIVLPDPEQDFSSGYDGKDVVVENLRQLCFLKFQMRQKNLGWWNYMSLKEKRYNKECADAVIKSLGKYFHNFFFILSMLSITLENGKKQEFECGLDAKKIDKCMGNPDADSEQSCSERRAKCPGWKGSRGDVTILPTLVVNNRQYRGKLEKGAVLKANLLWFEETTEPEVCLSGVHDRRNLVDADVETNECLDNNGLLANINSHITACRDTFRGRVCECPLVDGVPVQRRWLQPLEWIWEVQDK
ncbi:hypothetical protein NC653_022220 [Populus alba x Populus x berolinensis]|uniref:Vacuolar sorting receptor thioredoxin-like domain-containing protein n=1 Tax=Populus alba x Populus x berolinensis TaxID=444605 RepID=A0AAD6Q9I9_9ROSI|nr:hypothetical protein NC653_022220 [Populus alba x Populus x berolinensis]